MSIKFTPNHFKEIIERGFSMDQVTVLKWIHEQVDLTALINCESAKLTAIFQSILRKGLVNDASDKLTTLGQELLLFIDTKDPGKMVRKKSDSTDFDLWWKEFPSTNTFTYKGVHFEGDRSLKQKKDECRLKIEKILLDGEYTIQDLIAALNYEIIQKKESSLKTRTNKISYMHNSLTYLNQMDYNSFIELIKEGNVINTQNKIFDGVNL